MTCKRTFREANLLKYVGHGFRRAVHKRQHILLPFFFFTAEILFNQVAELPDEVDIPRWLHVH